jgi:transcriptional regulator with PAS, ATPase and Fis domain
MNEGGFVQPFCFSDSARNIATSLVRAGTAKRISVWARRNRVDAGQLLFAHGGDSSWRPAQPAWNGHTTAQGPEHRLLSSPSGTVSVLFPIGDALGAVCLEEADPGGVAQARVIGHLLGNAIENSSEPPLALKTPIVGQSVALKRALRLVDRIAAREVPVLLVGESGTGKELFARRLHERSDRRQGPFLALNCGSVTKSLIETQLFGYEQGAFTGARRRTKGMFEEANGGTLLLDEVHELSPEAQVSLLRVLQGGEIRRVGGSHPVKVDVRIIAASPIPLGDVVDRGEFRDDLFFRLNVFPIQLPPLRDRTEDIPALSDHILDLIARRERQARLTLGPAALQRLAQGQWPGNVRELQSVIERGAALADGLQIRVDDLGMPQVRAQEEPRGGFDSLRAAARAGRPLEEVELAYMLAVLREQDYSRSRTAAALGISTNTLWRKLKNSGYYDSSECARDDEVSQRRRA